MLYSLSQPSVRTRYYTQNMVFSHKLVQKLVNVDYRANLAIAGVVPGPAGEEIVARPPVSAIGVLSIHAYTFSTGPPMASPQKIWDTGK